MVNILTENLLKLAKNFTSGSITAAILYFSGELLVSEEVKYVPMVTVNLPVGVATGMTNEWPPLAPY